MPTLIWIDALIKKQDIYVCVCVSIYIIYDYICRHYRAHIVFSVVVHVYTHFIYVLGDIRLLLGITEYASMGELSLSAECYYV